MLLSSLKTTDLSIQTNEESQRRFLNKMSKVQLPFYIVATGMDVWTLLGTGYFIAWFESFFALFGIVLTVIVIRLSRRVETVRLGSWLIIPYTIFNISLNTFISGSLLPVPGIALFPLILSLYLLPRLATISLTLITLGFTFTLYIVELNGYRPPVLQDAAFEAYQAMVVWLIVIPAPVLVCAHIISQLKLSLTTAVEQNRQLKEALDAIEQKRLYSQTVGEQLNSVIIELNATSTQQASGSQQQAAAITQSISSLEELAQTAREIALKANSIDGLSKNILDLTNTIQEAVTKVVATGEHGQLSVERTQESNRQVSNLYNTLVDSFNNLKDQSIQIKGITDLIRLISDETHLLSLNAALEAAGAGVYGERFSVVANEVKNLADRSRNASREIAQILGQVEEGINQSVQKVVDGQQETRQALKLSVESGEVIRQLAIAVASTGEEMAKIAGMIETMSELTGIINLATNQQFSASRQAVEILSGVGTVAQQSAAASVQLTRTAGNLEQLAQGLTEALNA